jgi:hypothetical protein
MAGSGAEVLARQKNHEHSHSFRLRTHPLRFELNIFKLARFQNNLYEIQSCPQNTANMATYALPESHKDVSFDTVPRQIEQD